MINGRDAFFFIGLTVLAAGCSMIYIPAGPICFGTVMIGVVIFGIR